MFDFGHLFLCMGEGLLQGALPAVQWGDGECIARLCLACCAVGNLGILGNIGNLEILGNLGNIGTMGKLFLLPTVPIVPIIPTLPINPHLTHHPHGHSVAQHNPILPQNRIYPLSFSIIILTLSRYVPMYR